MKNAKKFAVLLLALVMVFALPVTAFAAGSTYVSGRGSDETGTITINNAADGETYTVYKILDLESYDTDSGAYSYKVNDTWSEFINSDGINDVYVKVDDQGYVTWVENADAMAFAKLALAYAEENKITAEDTATATRDALIFDDLELGYYLISSSKGTICALVTTDPDAVINEKNEAPFLDKQVEEDSNESWGKANDADIGQEVNFKITVTAQPGAENYVVHDRMGNGFNFDGDSIVVTAGGDTLTENTDYVIYSPGLETDSTPCAFEVAFTQDYLDTITEKTEIVIEFTAILNASADCTICGNENTSWLTYGDGSETPESSTETYTWSVPVFKYTIEDETETPLAGATFTLSTDSEGKNLIQLVATGTDTYRVARADEINTVTKITTDATGTFTIQGLDSGTYYLTEITAPDGYNELDGPVTIVIDDQGGVNATAEEPGGVDAVKVLNQSGSEIPSTGGIGTTIFYAAGTVLVLGAAVLMIVKKRMSVEK